MIFKDLPSTQPKSFAHDKGGIVSAEHALESVFKNPHETGEGVQIGDGEINFATLSEQLARFAPHAGFIPEIWQGHKNEGEGFWLALERLEQWF